MSESTPEALEARIDRWLWAARIFKSRSQATQACRSGRVQINGRASKASQIVSPGDKVDVRMPPITRSWRVLAPAVKRVSARLAVELAEEVTSAEELERWAHFRRDPVGFIAGGRAPGSGRPTKKERRQVNRLKSGKPGSIR
ncbi:MAG: RNA-binding S4 domain-containing protein [Acidobacteriota bacterium]|jgi:ribosome-associated heat shock protein Hsp15|nr:RNA-binding S4 domain-containing protein [Acidobacteriota bacterium]